MIHENLSLCTVTLYVSMCVCVCVCVCVYEQVNVLGEMIHENVCQVRG